MDALKYNKSPKKEIMVSRCETTFNQSCSYIQGAAKKVAPLMVFANFSAVVPEFKVKFGTLV